MKTDVKVVFYGHCIIQLAAIFMATALDIHRNIHTYSIRTERTGKVNCRGRCLKIM